MEPSLTPKVAEWKLVAKESNLLEEFKKVLFLPWQFWATYPLFVIGFTVSKLVTTRQENPSVLMFLTDGIILSLFGIIWILAPRPSFSLAYQILRRPARFGSAVTLYLFKSGETLGQDEGLVTIEDGLLCYQGRATSFALSRADLVNVEPAYPHQKNVQFFTLTSDPEQKIALSPLKGFGLQPIRELVQPWLNDPPTALRESLFPPNVKQPERETVKGKPRPKRLA